ncbi:hypothetical protein [Luminiphilus syltensis]|uniref:hypothetical protein n=1 Tax=Luminiphilus syltensis TaxID=1341119 RepID=UPI00058D3D6B|nr:hypothetical protein [Luminiphilus syltensis]
MDKFEEFVRELTTEINGQYPRPWMTDMKDPSKAKVFVVGYNPASAYSTGKIDYERYIDSLLNRNGEDCRSFYREVTHTSPTRGNIEMFTDKLRSHGVSEIIETNVVCYGTGKKKYLSLPENYGGKERGIEIFRALLDEIRPRAVVVHGAGVVKEVNRALVLKPALPGPPKTPSEFVQCEMAKGVQIFVIPSLALPGYQNWPSSPYQSFCNWADEYLNEISRKVASTCSA